MKWIRVLIAFVLFIVLVVWYAREQNVENEKKEKEKVSSKVLALADKETIESVRLESEKGKIELRQSGKEAWQMIQPLQSSCDRYAVGDLIRVLTYQVRGKNVADGGIDLKTFGLDRPAVLLVVKTSLHPQERTLLLGDKAPVGLNTYAKWKDEESVFLVDSALREQCAQSAAAFRDKEIFRFAENDVTELQFKLKDKSIVLVKENGKWQMREPIYEPVDPRRVESLLYELGALSVKDFAEASEVPGNLLEGLDHPNLTLIVKAAGNEFSLRLAGPDSQKEAYLALGGKQSGLIWIDKEIIDQFPKDENELVDRTLFHFEPVNIIQLSYENAGLKKDVEKKGEEWFFSSAEKKPEQFDLNMDKFLNFLVELQYVRKVSPQEQKAAQFGSPAVFRLKGKGGEEATFRWIRLPQKTYLLVEENPVGYELLEQENLELERLVNALFSSRSEVQAAALEEAGAAASNRP